MDLKACRRPSHPLGLFVTTVGAWQHFWDRAYLSDEVLRLG